MKQAGVLTWGPVQAGPEHREDWSVLKPSPGAGGQCPAEGWLPPSLVPPAAEGDGCPGSKPVFLFRCPDPWDLTEPGWLAFPSQGGQSLGQ